MYATYYWAFFISYPKFPIAQKIDLVSAQFCQFNQSAKFKIPMDPDLQQYTSHFHHKHQMNTAGGGGGGLTRYRSAPSSYFSAFMDSTAGAGEFTQPQPRPLSPETESILAQFMDNVGDCSGSGSTPLRPSKLYDIPEYSPVMQQPQFMGSVKQETAQIQRFNYQPISNSAESNFNSGGGRSSSNLIRHRSSPAGLFDDIIIEDGNLVNKESGKYGSGANSHINFSISENQMVAGNSNGSQRFNDRDEDSLMTGFPARSWDDSTGFSGPENQNREGRSRPAGLLAHHLSLPKGSMEKLLQFEDSVPCKMRAKRGFATHPRSVAERVRRTKISERMRKLQDLVPNMDKQTNTSDMLELAVDYIKELQKQVKTLADKRDKCTCTS